MKTKKALTLAIDAMHQAIQKIAANAHLYDDYQLETPGTVAASKHRKELLEAIEVLISLKEQSK